MTLLSAQKRRWTARAVVAAAAVPLVVGGALSARFMTPAHAAAAAQTTTGTSADSARGMLGAKAPDFSLPDQNDKPHTLGESKGKWVVLAFYPADMTTGCTFQNISYTKNLDKFAPLNAVVYTVSTQDTNSKREFCSKDQLKHTLLADVGGKTAASYGVLVGKVARRVTFYITPEGNIADVDTSIRTQSAAEDSLAKLTKLQSAPPRAGEKRETRTTVDGQPVRTENDPHLFVGAASQKVTLGSPLPDFSVVNVASGQSAGFTTLSAGKKATVLVFMSTQCPVSNAYADRLQKIATAYAAKGVAVVGIDSNVTETSAEAAGYAKDKGLTFPLCKDADSKVATQFRAQVTPEVYVADEKGVLVYHGPIDDSQDPSGVSKHYLTDALDSVLAGQPVAVKSERAFGCGIKKP